MKNRFALGFKRRWETHKPRSRLALHPEQQTSFHWIPSDPCHGTNTCVPKMLSIKRPTHTTVLYTVSTRYRAKALSAKIATALLICARILAGTLVAIALLWEYRHASPFDDAGQLSWLETEILAFPLDQFTSLLATRVNWPWRVLIYVSSVWLVFRRDYVEESLLVIRGLGVQTSTTSSSYLWTGSTRFIPTSTIQDIFIHEAFKGFEVRFYLNIVIEADDDVVVVFPNILPRREILEDVWRGTRACLYEPRT